jgi:hypothetical protein
VAERSLLSGIRPVLIPSREEDPAERVRFGDEVVLVIAGHGASIRRVNGNVYMGLGLRNGGNGLAVIHGWRLDLTEFGKEIGEPAVNQFRRQLRDLYIPAGDSGFWQAAIRDPSDPALADLKRAKSGEGRLVIDLLYGDYEGGQRTIARFSVAQDDEQDGHRAEVVRYWNVDGGDPR